MQLDEIRTCLRRRADVLWLWVALDPCTKLIPVLHVGPRTQEAAYAVIHRLGHVLAPGCCRSSPAMVSTSTSTP
jgi:hypothetical protein